MPRIASPILLAVILWPVARSFGADDSATTFKYPQARLTDQVDDYHGTQVADPYRWLENPDSPETRAWIEAENEITFQYLEQIPARDKLQRRLTELWDFEKYGVPTARGGRYLFSKNDGLQNQSVLYVAGKLDEQGRLADIRELLDPNKLSEDGTVALSGYELSDDGKLLAYGLSTAGSDWQVWKVRQVDNAADLEDTIDWVKFSGASWTTDSQGFFYSRYDEPNDANKFVDTNYFQKLYYHKIGTPQSADPLIYERQDQKEWGFGGHVTEDGRYLIITVSRGTERKNGVFYLALDDFTGRQGPDYAARVKELLTDFDAQYLFVGNEGPLFWFLTDSDAPRYRLIGVDINQPERENWQQVIAQADDVLENVNLVGDKFIALYLKDARSQVKLFDLAGKFEREIALPGLGTATGFTGRRNDRQTFYAYVSFNTPATIYRYDMQSNESRLVHRPKLSFSPDDYLTEQIFYESKDGTRVPMFISYKRGLVRNGQTPTLLYGYGGFNISLTPSYSVANLVWMELGGIFAMPNLRGGGEYGRAWHEAGMKLNKQNVFDDFIAAAEWLIDNRYTSRERLAISGRSNGGLLVGAALTQRPDLFGAALPGVGVLDMLRFHRFTIGWAWVSDYGSAEDPDEFKALYAYSPLHNIKPGTQYPPTLITTADHDDRVVPAHSFKFAAALQAAQAGSAPVLIRIDTKAGHGAGKPTAKLIEEAADTLAFLVKALGMTVE
jgi:prolyl oligopeptidase